MNRYLVPPPPPELRGRGNPTFSVIIPAFQAADVIGEAVESALSQSFPPLEVIVSDDGSTDDLPTALSEHRDEIVLLRNPHGGAAAAANAAVAAARGEFVAWLDADDAYAPGRLGALADLARERPDLDILVTDLLLEDGTGTARRFTHRTPFATSDQEVAILDRCFISAPAVRRRSLVAIGGMDESLRFAHDWDCWLRLLRSGSRAGMVDAPLYRYRLHPGSLTSHRAEALRDRVRVLEKLERREPAMETASRDALRRSLRICESRARLAELQRSLRGGDRDLRSRAFALATSRDSGARTRLKAGAAVAAPGLARRWARRRPGSRPGA